MSEHISVQNAPFQTGKNPIITIARKRKRVMSNQAPSSSKSLKDKKCILIHLHKEDKIISNRGQNSNGVLI